MHLRLLALLALIVTTPALALSLADITNKDAVAGLKQVSLASYPNTIY